ncbi:MAG: winged helix-turn-helix domain-containing protein [Acidobacteria bacterium]|nr:winged helix-turn-helix domain-containing protein [Acidobacteriota bacterium]
MNTNSPSPIREVLPIYLFDQFQLDLQNERLLLDKEPISLQRKAFETLTLLVKNSGRIVTKEEFLQELWPDSFVEEGSLTVNISLLRKALGEGQDGRKYIETIPRRGYRFIAPVRELNPTRTDPLSNGNLNTLKTGMDRNARSVRSSWKLIGISFALLFFLLIALIYGRWISTQIGAITSLGKTPRRMAVLPLINLKPDSENEYLSFSLADAITSGLGNIRDLRVQSSSSVHKYSNRTPDPQEVAKDLKVDMILTGTYIKEADDLRITTQMVDGKTGNILWQEKFDLKYKSLLKLQEQVALHVISQMGMSMASGEISFDRHETSSNPLAYEYFLRGIDHYAAARLPLAIEFFDKAVTLDPDFTRSWDYLGSSYALSASTRFGGRTYYEKAQKAYEQAIALHPERPRTMALQADLFIETNRVEQAVTLLRELINKHPTYPMAYWELSYAYRYAGMLEESIATSNRMLEVDPNYNLQNAVMSSFLYKGEYGRFRESIPAHTDSAYLIFYRGFASYHEGDISKAIADFDRAYAMDPSLMQAQVGKALSYSLAGKRAEGIRLMQEAERLSEESGVSDAEGIYKIAQAYAVLNDQASAIRILHRSIEGGFFCYPYISRDPLLKTLSADDRFEKLLAQARQRHEDFKRKFF